MCCIYYNDRTMNENIKCTTATNIQCAFRLIKYCQCCFQSKIKWYYFYLNWIETLDFNVNEHERRSNLTLENKFKYRNSASFFFLLFYISQPQQHPKPFWHPQAAVEQQSPHSGTLLFCISSWTKWLTCTLSKNNYQGCVDAHRFSSGTLFFHLL